MKLLRTATLAFFSLGLLITSLHAHAINRLEIDSYNYLSDSTWGVVRTEVLTEQTGYFKAYNPYPFNPNYEQSISISFDSYVFLQRWITLSFSANPRGIEPLGPGIYEGATRFPFNEANPGLDFTDTGGGFNTLEGRFQILEIEKNSEGVYTSFVANFTISNYPAPFGQPLIGGRVWYSLEAPVTSVPEPQNLALLLAGLGVLGLAVRHNKPQ